MATPTITRPSGVNDTALPAVPISLDRVIAHLAMRPAEAEAFVAGLADALIQAKDAADGDPDLEPVLGYSTNGGADDECEPDVDDELSGDEKEPSLGSIGSSAGADRADQRLWATGFSDDLEQEITDEPHDDEGDGEPVNGSLDRALDQRRWAEGGAGLWSWEGELDRSDYEPSLGSLEGQHQHHNQLRWGASATRDQEPNGDELDEDNRHLPRDESELWVTAS